MQTQQGNQLPGILFLGLWYMIEVYTPYAGNGFGLALLMTLFAWVTLRFFATARMRLGARAWSLMAQVAAWTATILWLYPAPLPGKIVVLGLWIPVLLFVGALTRLIVDRIGMNYRSVLDIASVVSLSMLVFFTMWSLFTGHAFWGVFWAAGALAGQFYGWELAAPSPQRHQDARMGSADGFEDSGMSHER